MTDPRPHYVQNPTPYLNVLALITLYLLIRTIEGQPEDAAAIATLAGLLQPKIAP